MMKILLAITMILMVFVHSAVSAAGMPTAKAGKYTVALATHPAAPTVGETKVTFTVTDAGKPVSGADVSVHIDMVGMSMPADVPATPGTAAGQYVATVNFSMAGQWKVIATVHAMAGMTMDGDGTAAFTITAQQVAGASTATPPLPSSVPTSPATPAQADLPWSLIIGGVILLGIVIVVVVVRGRGKKTPGD